MPDTIETFSLMTFTLMPLELGEPLAVTELTLKGG